MPALFYYKMRKRIFGRRLKRDTNQRKALFRSLMISLVTHGKIRTTEAKAKSIKGEIEKLVTVAKNDGESARRLIMSHIPHEKIADKIISEIAPLFKTRPGGYTRIIRMGPRVKDAADMVLMTWTEEVKATVIIEAKRNANKEKKPKTKVEKTPKAVENKTKEKKAPKK